MAFVNLGRGGQTYNIKGYSCLYRQGPKRTLGSWWCEMINQDCGKDDKVGCGEMQSGLVGLFALVSTSR